MNMGENKKYKTDTKAFVVWLKHYMVGYGEFEPLVKSKTESSKTQENKPAYVKPKHEKKPEAKFSKKIAAVAKTVSEKPMKEDVAKASKVPDTNFIKEGKPSCFKCFYLKIIQFLNVRSALKANQKL